MEKILTISIAAYNVETYLENTLNSLIDAQILEKIEVLIENDGSTDNTVKIAEQFVNKYPDTFKLINKKNGGYGSTINNSIKLATGKYFKQLDGDDWFVTDHLPKFINLLSEIDCDYVITPFINYSEAEKKERFVDCVDYLSENTYNFNDLQFRDYVNMHSSTFKTKLLKKMSRRITEHCFYTDTELVCFPIPLIETVYIWHTSIYVYRVGREGQSISKDGIIKHYREHERVLNHLCGVFREIEGTSLAKERFLKIRIRMEISAHYKYVCYLPDKKKSISELKRFTKFMSDNYPELLQLSKDDSKFVNLMTESRFLLYPVLKRLI